jgi:Sec-independent protein translocase protein TatA
MDFLGIGGWEIIFIIILALILFGPGKIVSVARTMGKIVYSLRKLTSELTTNITREIDAQEKKETPTEIHKQGQS